LHAVTYLFNDPVDFADEMVEGFVAANGRWVRGVRGGVVRATDSRPGTVAVVIGGGSGHYPAFAGLVGPGLAAGAAMGNLFASPSAQQVHSVATAADAGGGILLAYGNYAGDVLNFDQAETRLRADGIDCATVVVTDDVSSAPRDQLAKRRGVAGGLIVYKVAGAAAQAGLPLAEVAAVAGRANGRTRTIGVAFSGCTLPGASEPLFTVAPGVMEVGMGIHGEPGISEAPYPTADELAELFTDRLLAEVPGGVRAEGARVVLILNGLGSVKYEELFVVYRRVAELARAAGLVIVDSQVGEFVTSFEMAGASLTVCWLDDELERFWLSPATSPAFTQVGDVGLPGKLAAKSPAISDTTQRDARDVPDASPASATLAIDVERGLAAARAAIAAAESELGRLDAIAGDGDHGIGMHRGITAAAKAATEATRAGAGAGTTLVSAGEAWADRAGGTSGAIWGIILKTVGESIGDDAVPDLPALATAVTRAEAAVAEFGRVAVGDKTLYDVLEPVARSLSESAASGERIDAAWTRACETADAAAAATAQLIPRVGRARPHAEKSLGITDPGAVSFAILVNAVRPFFRTIEDSKGKANE
jgi:dihydroxyacetone kinase